MEPGNVIWITGISGSGKTTLGRRITNWLRENGEMVVFLDGDELRKIFDSGNKFDYQSRLSLAVSYSKLCKVLSDSGATVVICTISLFHFVHRWNRENISQYVEVFIDAPLSLVRYRDPKGIYEKYFNMSVLLIQHTRDGRRRQDLIGSSCDPRSTITMRT